VATRLTDRRRSDGGDTRDKSSLPSPPAVQMCHLPESNSLPAQRHPSESVPSGCRRANHNQACLVKDEKAVQGQRGISILRLVPIDPEVPAAAMLESMRHLVAGVADGWTRAEPGALAVVTGVALPTLNGVCVASLDADVEVVADLLDQVAATGLPHCLQVRPDAAKQVTDLAVARGMTREQLPMMVLEDSSQLDATRATGGLVIRELVPADAHLHARAAAAGFEAPVELFLQLMTPALLALPGVHCYLGEVDGQPVTTGFGVTFGSYVAIFNIATPLAQRRRGYGAAVTARAVADGLAAGAKWAWLQASELGYPVYERLGFRTAEVWSCWLSETATDP